MAETNRVIGIEGSVVTSLARLLNAGTEAIESRSLTESDRRISLGEFITLLQNNPELINTGENIIGLILSPEDAEIALAFIRVIKALEASEKSTEKIESELTLVKQQLAAHEDFIPSFDNPNKATFRDRMTKVFAEFIAAYRNGQLKPYHLEMYASLFRLIYITQMKLTLSQESIPKIYADFCGYLETYNRGETTLTQLSTHVETGGDEKQEVVLSPETRTIKLPALFDSNGSLNPHTETLLLAGEVWLERINQIHTTPISFQDEEIPFPQLDQQSRESWEALIKGFSRGIASESGQLFFLDLLRVLSDPSLNGVSLSLEGQTNEEMIKILGSGYILGFEISKDEAVPSKNNKSLRVIEIVATPENRRYALTILPIYKQIVFPAKGKPVRNKLFEVKK